MEQPSPDGNDARKRRSRGRARIYLALHHQIGQRGKPEHSLSDRTGRCGLLAVPRPMWDRVEHSFRQFGRKTLVRECSVMWRRAPRPSRRLATKGGWGFFPRADCDVVHYLSSSSCATRSTIASMVGA